MYSPGQKTLEVLSCITLLVITVFTLAACSQQTTQILVTIADARNHPAQFIDIGVAGDSPGDILTFDQPLLDVDKNKIGNNSGSCIRTQTGHIFQCQWTLVMEEGNIQIAGREYDKGSSVLSIIGGTGIYSGINGYMESTNNNDGTFTQKLHFVVKH